MFREKKNVDYHMLLVSMLMSCDQTLNTTWPPPVVPIAKNFEFSSNEYVYSLPFFDINLAETTEDTVSENHKTIKTSDEGDEGYRSVLTILRRPPTSAAAASPVSQLMIGES